MTTMKYIRRGLLGLLGLFVVTLVAINIETLAESKGWNLLLSDSIDPAMSILDSIVENSWFWSSFWFVFGATAGTWLTYFSYRDKTKFQEKEGASESSPIQMPSEAWRHVGEYTLWQIAHLWVGQEPKSRILDGDPAYPIFRMLKTDVTKYKLWSAEDSAGKRILIHAEGDRKTNVDGNILINRNTLLSYIKKNECTPKWDFGSIDSPSKSERQCSHISLLDFAREAENRGWRFTDDSSQHIFDFVRKLRDAGSTETIQFWGRAMQRIATTTKNQALVKIPSGYWQEFKIDGIFCLEHSKEGAAIGIASDNQATRTTDDTNQTRMTSRYADISLDRSQAVFWLETVGGVPGDG